MGCSSSKDVERAVPPGVRDQILNFEPDHQEVKREAEPTLECTAGAPTESTENRTSDGETGEKGGATSHAGTENL